MDYIFVQDIYSQGAITYAQATTAFTNNTPASAGSNIVAPAGTDPYANTLTNGGIYTSSTSPLVTATFPGTGQNYVLMIRGKDTDGNTLGYLYFYVNITMSTTF